MTIDVSKFFLYNVTDTCSVWNVLSSRTLHSISRQASVHFVCPAFVMYECLHKPRSSNSPEERELRARLEEARTGGAFQTCELDITDLQTIEILEQRKRLGKGELSSIALAKKIGQACLTDDQKARRLAAEVIEPSKVQTTPHLFGWLVFMMHLADGEVNTVVSEHEAMGRPLATYFRKVHQEACRCRLMEYPGGMHG